MKRTKFTASQWRWTGPKENLFQLDKFELAVFFQFCQEANNG